MKGGAQLATLALVAAACGCAPTGKLEIRQAGAAAPRLLPAAQHLDEARMQLAIGHTGLALQSFRQALRADPQSVNALAGIAGCYEAMGRTDLSRRYFEEALAIDPGNLSLLGLLAASLHRQGKTVEANSIRAEMARRQRPGAPAVQWTIDDRRVATLVASEPATVTVALPPVADSAPPARLPVAPPAKPQARLERVSMGEVALVTSGKPLWVPMTRFAATREPAASVLLLNAARRQGLAATTRARLRTAGVEWVAIGNAPQVRARTLIAYPVERRSDALALSRHFRTASLAPRGGSRIIVYLGRDAADLRRE